MIQTYKQRTVYITSFKIFFSRIIMALSTKPVFVQLVSLDMKVNAASLYFNIFTVVETETRCISSVNFCIIKSNRHLSRLCNRGAKIYLHLNINILSITRIIVI